MENKVKIPGIILAIILSAIVIFLNTSNELKIEPKELYKVFVDGKVIGTIASKENFESYVNSKEEEIKTRYGVNKIYPPSEVEIKKVATYDNKAESNETIYNRIIATKKFTIKGIIITIEYDDGKESQKIYTLDKSIFDEALKKSITSFIEPEIYEKFINDTQEEIVDLGMIVDDINIRQNITYKEGYISVDEKIYTSVEELAKYLMYGTLDEQAVYYVNEGDTIETIAENNKLNIQEFLIANSNFNSKNNLLYVGQKVNVSLINPIIEVVVETTSVEEEEKAFAVDIKYDENELKGIEYVEREGENGLYKVKKKYQYINGQIADTTSLSQVELKPAVNKIIVKGDKYVPEVADLSYWAWPTDRPYTITTYYGYRWGSMHAAIDISGTGHGSNIYAANNGTIIAANLGCYAGNSSCNGGRGNFIVINHNIGNYYTMYMHLASISVKVGQTVQRGQKIGTMGNTGFVYPAPTSSSPYSGTHLDFSTYKGNPLNGSRNPFNPLNLY